MYDRKFILIQSLKDKENILMTHMCLKCFCLVPQLNGDSVFMGAHYRVMHGDK